MNEFTDFKTYKMRKMNFTLSKHVLARDLFESFQINFIIPVFLP